MSKDKGEDFANQLIDYSNYLAENLDKDIRYSEYASSLPMSEKHYKRKIKILHFLSSEKDKEIENLKKENEILKNGSI